MGRPSNREPGAVWALIAAWSQGHPLKPNQRQVAGLLGVSQSLLSAWKFAQSTMQPNDVEAIARKTGISFDSLARAVADDHPRVQEFQAAKEAARRAAKNREPAPSEDEIASAVDRYLTDHDRNHREALLAIQRDLLLEQGGVKTPLYLAVRAQLEALSAECVTEGAHDSGDGEGASERTGVVVALASSGKHEAFSKVVVRYLEQADGDPAEAASLLAHDGPKGAGVDQDDWLKALTELNRRRTTDGSELLAVAAEDEGDEGLAREATKQARKSRAEQLAAIEEMNRKKDSK